MSRSTHSSIVLTAPTWIAAKYETLVKALPPEIIGLRPTLFVFDDPQDWTIHDFFINTRSQLKPRGNVSARDFADAIVDGGCDTIQARMDISMIVIPQKNGIRFRCVISGPAVLA